MACFVLAVLQAAHHARCRCRCSSAAFAHTTFHRAAGLCAESARDHAAVSARRAVLACIPRDARHDRSFAAGLLRQKLERLCRYVSRPPVAVDRLALTLSGQVRFTSKAPYRDGTTQIVLEPLDLIARSAALVLPPRMYLTRYHGVFAPHSKLRSAVTPAGRGKGMKRQAVDGADRPATPRHVAMSWAKRLKPVLGVDIEACARCGGKLEVIASIEESTVVAKILAHLGSAQPRSSIRPSCPSEHGHRRPRRD